MVRLKIECPTYFMILVNATNDFIIIHVIIICQLFTCYHLIGLYLYINPVYRRLCTYTVWMCFESTML